MPIDVTHLERAVYRHPPRPLREDLPCRIVVVPSGRLAAPSGPPGLVRADESGSGAPVSPGGPQWGRHVVVSRCLLPGEDELFRSGAPWLSAAAAGAHPSVAGRTGSRSARPPTRPGALSPPAPPPAAPRAPRPGAGSGATRPSARGPGGAWCASGLRRPAALPAGISRVCKSLCFALRLRYNPHSPQASGPVQLVHCNTEEASDTQNYVTMEADHRVSG